jgi:dTMP kinase
MDRMTSRRGRFIVFEGADGCGKSTQAARLASALLGGGREVLHVRDPGSTKLAEAIRAILLDPKVGHVAVEAEVSLYLAARSQLVSELVEPALRNGSDVVCERWTLSTEVYQGVAGGFGAPRVRRAAAAVLPRLEPDLTLVLDVGVGQGLRRLARDLDRMEGKGEKFHADVVRAYRRLAARRPRTVLVPTGTLDEVADAVRSRVGALDG